MSSEIMAITKAGFNALTETNPNNFIFHSAYNGFKILYQGKTTINVVSGTTWYSFAHNSPLGTPSCMVLFEQFPDGKVTPISYGGAPEAKSYNNAYSLTDSNSAGIAFWDSTNIHFSCNGVGSAYNITFVWYIFEPPL